MRNDNRGIILVFVLIFTTAIATAVLFFYSRSERHLKRFTYSSRFFYIRQYSDMGKNIGRHLLREHSPTYSWIGEDWAQEKVFISGGIYITININDERAKINPNKIFKDEGGEDPLHMDIFRNFYAIMGYSEVLSDSLLDWIDEDNLARPGGAEAFYYRTGGYDYVPPNRNLYSPEEVLLVRGYTDEIFFGDEENELQGLIDFITTSSDGKINVNTAPREILNALGFTSENVQNIIEARENGPVEEAFLMNINRDVYMSKRDIIAFKSDFFSITVGVKDEDSGIEKNVREYIRRGETIITLRQEIL